ncbi:hypothetical protein [Larkinella soli]|uniref:hypothetical protein n=1 Tax=Larkinella soli TaxID=1770527 RepID=UPI000FFC639B|nr:hypothetical protein [Larkinella soli]
MKKTTFPAPFVYRIGAFLMLSLVVVSCLEDHEGPDPASACIMSTGAPRPYPCEFVLEKLIILNKDGTTMDEVTSTDGILNLDRTQAKLVFEETMFSYLKVDVKAVIKRVANPSFTSPDNYRFISTSVLEALTSDTQTTIAGPVPVTAAVGSSVEVPFEWQFNYQFSGGIRTLFAPPRVFYIQNVATFPMVGGTIKVRDKAEAYLNFTVTL